MRSFFILPVLALVLTGCQGKPAATDPDRDSRYDLVRYNMEPILFSDMKSCLNYMRVGGLGKAQLSDDLKVAFQISADVWSNLKSDMDVYADKKTKALVKGSFTLQAPDELSSIFTDGDNLEAKSTKCGEIAGRVNVQVGLLSTRDSIEMTQKMMPDFFKNMGVTEEQIKVGLEAIDKRVERLSGEDKDSILTCAAISQADKLKDPQSKPYSDAWTQLLTAKIDSGAFEAAGFQQDNAFWASFARSGAGKIGAIEGYAAAKESCDAKMRAAMQGGE